MTEPLTWSHRTAAIPEGGLHETRQATAAERAAIASTLGILSCDAMTADYRLRALGEGRYLMTGKLIAQVTLACVVTLEPVPETIEEEIDVAFWPTGTLPEPGDAEVEVSSAPEIEPIEHGEIDTGRVLFEVLSASLDPYPRKPGARFEWEDEAGPSGPEATGPFAALKKLKGDS
jgi:hypothetical protein